VLTENGENNSCSEEHVSSVVAQRSRERKGQKGHLSKVLTSAEKLLRFGVGGNKLLSSFNQAIYPHSCGIAGAIFIPYQEHSMRGHSFAWFADPVFAASK
jgi:hypothetical protein